MADIKNYTLNFSFGRPVGLDFADAKSACAEIERKPVLAEIVIHG